MTQLKETLNGNDSSLNLLNSAETNGLGTISSDINPPPPSTTKPQTNSSTTTTTASDRQQQNRNQSSNDSTQNQSIWQQSSHPVALFFLFLFRSLAIATYLLCGFFSDSYVFSTVIVVILLSIDFWTVRNISGRVLVGLRFWNQVDEDGSSYWVFESRDPSQAANPVDSKMFWMALYTFPVVWILLLFIGIIKFNLSFLPIVILALVFNLTNTIGFTYAVESPEHTHSNPFQSSTHSFDTPPKTYQDRDSKRKWANELGSSGINGLLGQFGGGLLGGLTKVGIGKFFG
ncbi:Golgi apparatus membrane protein tvp23 [Puccinia graminis f. sp. tritici]|uniref:Golgi apparatus membrane protein TVP23 n=1 Tax=Puccinia graminis f. sp. tritici TaxID=56615 RepID=A0A5B0PHV9_PUCGR|nr:Golgi apparatus membrane protein tvp23 [Puccinia graminis f. sp. tritici]